MKRLHSPLGFRDEVFLKARKLKDERELNYTIWRQASYFLSEPSRGRTQVCLAGLPESRPQKLMALV